MNDNYNNNDQYPRISSNPLKEIEMVLKKYLLYPVFGMKRMYRFRYKKNLMLAFFDKRHAQYALDRPTLGAHSISDYEDAYYLRMPKAACTSIRKAIYHIGDVSLADAGKIFDSREVSLNNIKNIDNKSFFSFVRNPFPRTASNYTDRVLRADDFRYWYDGRLAASEVLDFKDFVKKIASISDDISNEHFCSQSYLLTTRDGKAIPNCYIGHVETLTEDFEPLRQKYGFAPLEHVNKSSDNKTDWRDYYDEETAKLVYDRYREDFERFGYEEEYQKLISYLAKKRG